MNSILQELKKTNSVLGAFIFNENGEIYASMMPQIYTSQLSQISQTIAQCISPYQSEVSSFELNEFFIEFDDGCFLTRQVDDLYITLICEKNANMSLIKVALNIAKMKLKSKSTNDMMASNSISSSSISKHSMIGNTMSWGHTSASSANIPIPPDAIGKGNIQKLAKIYARFLGPAAKPVTKKCLRNLGVSASTISASQGKALVSLMCERIDNVEERSAFQTEAINLLTKALFQKGESMQNV